MQVLYRGKHVGVTEDYLGLPHKGLKIFVSSVLHPTYPYKCVSTRN